jgi:hypothetical protein
LFLRSAEAKAIFGGEPEVRYASVRPRGIGLRIVGGLLILFGVLGLYSLVSPRFLSLGNTGLIAAGPRESAILGLWIIGGFWAWMETALGGGLMVFGGIQLARLRRSGWITCAIILSYAIVSSFLLVRKGEIEGEFGVAYLSHMAWPVYGALVERLFPLEIRQVQQTITFLLVANGAMLVTMLAGRDIAVGRVRERRSKFRATLPVLALAAAAVYGWWALGGANYVSYREILAAAKAPVPTFDDSAYKELSDSRRAEIAAILVRRLATEKSEAVARCVDGRGGDELLLLTPEDTARLIEAAKTVAGHSQGVRDVFLKLLAEINTTEARQFIVDELRSSADPNLFYDVLRTIRARFAEVPESILRATELREAKTSPRIAVPWASRDGNDLQAIAMLGSFRDPKALARLLEIGSEGDVDRREEAIRQLRRFPCPEAEAALVKALRDPEMRVRDQACHGLGYIGGASAIQPLIDVLTGLADSYSGPGGHTVTSLHKEAGYALGRITRLEFATAAEWEAWWKGAGPTFDFKKNLVERLFAPMPPEPKTPYKTVEEMQADGYAKAAGTKAYTLQAIQQWELRELAPELAKYLRLPEREAPYNFMAAMALANWGYREGIDYFIERICIEEPGSRWVSIRFLSSGTGVNFFGDKARWQAWWKENRLRFPSAEEGRGDPKSE